MLRRFFGRLTSALPNEPVRHQIRLAAAASAQALKCRFMGVCDDVERLARRQFLEQFGPRAMAGRVLRWEVSWRRHEWSFEIGVDMTRPA
jgi:uncharacterized protein (DUF2236 family)